MVLREIVGNIPLSYGSLGGKLRTSVSTQLRLPQSLVAGVAGVGRPIVGCVNNFICVACCGNTERRHHRTEEYIAAKPFIVINSKNRLKDVHVSSYTDEIIGGIVFSLAMTMYVGT